MLLLFFCCTQCWADPQTQNLYIKAVVASEAGRFSTAERYYNLVLAKDNTLLDAHLGLVNALISRNDNQRGMRAVKIALENFQLNAELWSFAGVLQQRLGDTISAQVAFEKSINLARDNPGILLRAANFYDSNNNQKLAEELSQSAFRIMGASLPAR